MILNKDTRTNYNATTPLYDITLESGDKVSIIQGNDKLGKEIYNINLLSGDDCLSVTTVGLLTNVKGTCEGVCSKCGCANYCYDRALTKFRHATVIPSRVKNTLLMRANITAYFDQIQEFCNTKITRGEHKGEYKVKKFRYHSGGEIESYDYLLGMVRVAKNCPNTKFYFYTKQFGYLERYLKENKKFPENLVPNVSEWHDNTKGYNLKGLNSFVYDDGDDPEVSKLPHCPAVDKTGHETGVTCSKCGRCYTQTGKKTAVYAH